ncbi:MAG TPA: hypothetical protein P5020_05445, partial [Dysgonamonadaceae bacterium]|nr:hypothetical protein [Dysgonamonadaceae bacterium]
MNYELVLLANMIGRNYLEKELEIYYSNMELKNKTSKKPGADDQALSPASGTETDIEKDLRHPKFYKLPLNKRL